jgi:hypothetical protein
MGRGWKRAAASAEAPRQSLTRQLFFKWIKQHLRVKRFYGQSPNAVKSQIWIAISMYVLVAIVKKRLQLEASLYTLLQILSITLFEKMPINKALLCSRYATESGHPGNQLNLYDFDRTLVWQSRNKGWQKAGKPVTDCPRPGTSRRRDPPV